MKKETGAITLITLVTVLFMLAFLLSTYTIIMNRAQSQAEIKKETGKLYKEDVQNSEGIYDDYFAEDGETIPIKTIEHLLKIGTGEDIAIEGKIYKFSSDGNYRLDKAIALNVSTYQTEYSDLFQEETWVETETTSTSEVVKTTSTSSDSYTTSYKGTYRLEVWGGNGGSYSASKAAGGTGGYSKGEIKLEKSETLNIYVGGAGSYGTTTTYTAVSGGGTNGGGSAAYRGGAGGGGTDMRIGGTTLYYRVIVAGGGGGGSFSTGGYAASGGDGGGVKGEKGSYYNSTYSDYVGGRATQTSGGSAGTGYSANYNGKKGTFGTGANTGYKYNNTNAAYNSNGAGRRWLVWWRFCWKLWYIWNFCCI